jgi:hypothetical protein
MLYLAGRMKSQSRLITVVLIAVCFAACKSRQQAPLIGTWRLTDVSTRPAGAAGEKPPVGTVYTFRQDSTMLSSANPAAQHYELQKLPEGMFLVVGDSPKIQYRIVAMTPAELGLEQDRSESSLTLKLEFQPE